MGDWFRTNLAENNDRLRRSVARSAFLQSLTAKLRNQKLIAAGAISALAAMFGIWAWQASTAGGPAASVVAPADTDTQSQLSSQASTESGAPGGGSGGNDSNASVNINVNGQNIPVSQQGSTHKVIKNGNSTTTIDVSVDNQTSGDQQTSSSSSVIIDNGSDSSTTVHQNISQQTQGSQ